MDHGEWNTNPELEDSFTTSKIRSRSENQLAVTPTKRNAPTKDELDRLVQPERVRVPYGAEIRAERVAVDDSETMIGADCEKRNDEKSEEPHGTDRCMGE